MMTCGDCYTQNWIDSLGRKQGNWNYYNADSVLIEQGEYKNNLKTGTWKVYSKNGNLTDSGAFHNDRKIGIWMHWSSGGDYDVFPSNYEYHKDGGVTILRQSSSIYINRDSSYIALTLSPTYKQIECKCKNKVNKKFICVRYHESGKIYRRRKFADFAETFDLLETKW
jgi:hypothetical protein